MKKTIFPLLLVIILSALISGCAGTTTALTKRKLDVENKMSSTIFLEPVADDDRTVYVQVRNTSDQRNLDLQQQVVAALRMKGYQIVSNPSKAHYWLQANVLSVGQLDRETREEMIASGFGGGLTGGIVGAGAGALSGRPGAVAGGALAGAALGMLIDSTIKDVTYGITTDVQVSERTGDTVSARTESRLAQGDSTHTETRSDNQGHWNRYQTRIVSTANKANLKLDDAVPVLTEGMSHAIAGIF